MAAAETVGAALQRARELLQGRDSSRLDAEVLLAAVTGLGREVFYSRPERPLAPEHLADFNRLVQRRHEGYPVAYLTGHREFWSLEFKVSRDTLIPRPETERLVETALEFIAAEADLDVLDLGTGSGAVAVALAVERARCRITASDVSPEALALARENAEQARVGQIRFLEADWFTGLPLRSFDVIVSNPPYVASAQAGAGDIRFEPRLALDGGRSGLAALQTIIPAARLYLRPGGRLLLEHGHDQGAAVRRLLQLSHYVDIATRQDHAGLDRVTTGCWP